MDPDDDTSLSRAATIAHQLDLTLSTQQDETQEKEVRPFTPFQRRFSQMSLDSVSETRRTYLEHHLGAHSPHKSPHSQLESPSIMTPIDEHPVSPHVDRYGFLEESKETFKEVRVESKRTNKWLKMANVVRDTKHGTTAFSWNIQKKQFIKRLNKGIPDAWRGQAWSFLMSKWPVHEGRLNSTDGTDAAFYDQYTRLLAMECAEDRQIDLDINRTMRTHELFAERYGDGQVDLLNVLCAYANADPRLGYCQGMSHIAATFLLYFDDLRAFWMLERLLGQPTIHGIFLPGLRQALLLMHLQDLMMQRLWPKLFKHLDAHGITSTMYGPRWYCTLFCGHVLEHATLLRVLDVLFLHGPDSVLYISLALLHYFKKKLMVSSFEDALHLLNNSLVIQDNDVLISYLTKLLEPKRRAKTDAWIQEWTLDWEAEHPL